MRGSPSPDQRANAAETLLQNPILREAKKVMEDALVAQLKNLDLVNKDEEHEIVMLLRASEMYFGMLEGFLRSGNVEDIKKRYMKDVV